MSGIELYKPYSGQTYEKGNDIELSVKNSSTYAISEVKYYFQDPNESSGIFHQIGIGAPQSGTDEYVYFWKSDILLADGTTVPYNHHIYVHAVVKIDQQYCQAQYSGRPIIINATDTSTYSVLAIEILPNNWTGGINTSITFKGLAWLKSIDSSGNVIDVDDVTASALTTFKWQAKYPDGTIRKATTREFQFFSSSVAGKAMISLLVDHGGTSKAKSISINILPPEETTNYPISGSTTDDTQSPGTSTDIPKEILNREPLLLELTKSNQGDVVTAACLEQTLDESDFTRLKDGGRMTYAILSKSSSCFAHNSFIIPLNLSPVVPEQVKELPQEAVVKIEKPKNVETVNAEDKQGIILSGTAPANSDVLIYVFSQPLVITTKADENGNWAYILENPLEPGEHEAYLVMEKDGRFVRSDRIAFAIQPGEQTTENPNGYSLLLASSSSEDNVRIYIASGIALILIASVLLARFVWFRKPRPMSVISGSMHSNQTTPSPLLDVRQEETTKPSTEHENHIV
jgi:hypothetical protein